MRLLAIASFAAACLAYHSARRLLVAEEEQLREAADLAAAGGSDYGPVIDIGDDIEWWTGLRRASPDRVLGGLGA